MHDVMGVDFSGDVLVHDVVGVRSDSLVCDCGLDGLLDDGLRGAVFGAVDDLLG